MLGTVKLLVRAASLKRLDSAWGALVGTERRGEDGRTAEEVDGG